jgi:hypothetical protein
MSRAMLAMDSLAVRFALSSRFCGRSFINAAMLGFLNGRFAMTAATLARHRLRRQLVPYCCPATSA